MDLQDILSTQDLSNCNLSGCSLGGVDLRGKIFRGTNLARAHLGNANLSGADLRKACLTQANLGAANLTGADLRESDLRGANLLKARLTGADFRGAIGLPPSFRKSNHPPMHRIHFEETDEYLNAKNRGFFPLSYWGNAYLLSSGKTLQRHASLWRDLKAHLGELIFDDRQTFAEVLLVQQYKHYSQWAYMISKAGFERMVKTMGIELSDQASFH